MAIINQDRPLIYLFHEKYITGASKKVAGLKVFGDGLLRVQGGRPRAPAEATMRSFILRRAGRPLIVLFLSSVLVFVGVRALPGDPALALAGESRDPAALQAIREKYGLDKPVPVQYVTWLSHVVRGDLGESTQERAAGARTRSSTACR